MFQQLYELSQCLPAREDWERLNEGMPPIYDRGLAICFDEQGQWTGIEVYQNSNSSSTPVNLAVIVRVDKESLQQNSSREIQK